MIGFYRQTHDKENALGATIFGLVSALRGRPIFSLFPPQEREG
jgi:hypothetical protein